MGEVQKLFRIVRRGGYGFQSTTTVSEVGTMGRSSGGGGRGGGGSSGAGGGGVNQEPLGGALQEQSFGRGLSDDGNLLGFAANANNDTALVDTGDARADAAMVAAFRRGELNATPVFVRSTGLNRDTFEESFKAVDPVSARIMASAKAAGSRVNAIQVPADGSQDRIVGTLQRANGKPVFSRVSARSTGPGNSLDAGGLIRIPTSDVRGGTVTANQRTIDSAAKSIRDSGSKRAWTPISVRHNRDNKAKELTTMATATTVITHDFVC